MKTRKTKRWNPVLAMTMTAALWGAVTASAAVTGQWDFDNGDLSATTGQDLTYIIWGGDTAAQTQFGTTTALGIPDIGGQPAKVMKFPAALEGMGYSMPTPPTGNGGGTLVNHYTLILDVLYPAESDGKWRAIVDTDGGLLNPDAEFFVNTGNGIGVSGQYQGTIQADTWHRIAVTVDLDANLMSKYIDGVHVGAQPLDGVDGRWAMTPGLTADLFADNDGDTAVGYVNSIQLRDEVLSGPAIGALGGPSADGVPAVVPAIPSNFETWIPAADVALADTDVGLVVGINDANIAQNTIIMTINGEEQTGLNVQTAGGQLTIVKTPASPLDVGRYEVKVTYDETVDGATSTRSFERVLNVALFLEDFDDLVLGPAEEETFDGDYFTRTPPTDWSIDDTGMPGFDQPDYADQNGVNEFSGWSFVLYEGWVQTAGDQRRSEYTSAHNIVAVADPDEWDDGNGGGHYDGTYNSFLVTPEIDISQVQGASLSLSFDSSWRPEDTQTAVLQVRWDGGDWQEVIRWESDANSPFFHEDGTYINERVNLPLDAPEGATKLQVRLGMIIATNDWWWAVDNFALLAGPAAPFIESQPGTLEIAEGETAEFSVTVKGTAPFTYQWYRVADGGDVAIEGATDATLTIPNAQVADSGLYYVVVKNAVGEATSSNAKLIVLLSAGAMVVFEEDFNGVPLGDSVDERQDGTGTAGPVFNNVWTKEPPAGWSIDDSGVPGFDQPGVGVTEWKGWSFATVEFWNGVAGQGRDGFTKGTGAVAIADGDEWDDLGDAADLGFMNTFLSTPPIDISDVKAGSLKLQVDVSWNPENQQKANITASYDGGPEVELVRFDSSVAAEINGTRTLELANPAGAQTVVLKFGYFDAGNNWWFAVDNIKLTGEPAPLFFEDFNGVPLGDSVDELDGDGLPYPNAWTKTAPDGWSIDDSGVPNGGVTEWHGWSFATVDFWNTVSGQSRDSFTDGTGAVAIADGDEWDDAGHDPGEMSTFLSTPSIDISNQAPGTLALKFDSSWRPWDQQKGLVQVEFDGGVAENLLRYDSEDFASDAPVNETVTLALNNPEGAGHMVITFGYLDAGNDWWWAIDNIEVFVVAPGEGPTMSIALDGGNLTLSWDGGGTLQSAPTVNGPWTDVEGATSPYSTTATEGAAFFRVMQ